MSNELILQPRWGYVAIAVALAFGARLLYLLAPALPARQSRHFRPARARTRALHRPADRAAGLSRARAGDHRQGRRHQVDRQLRHPDPDLHHAGLGPEHRRRPRRPARSRLRRLLRRRRLRLRPAGHQRSHQGLHGRMGRSGLLAGMGVLDLPARCRPDGGVLGHPAGLPGAAPARRLSRHRHAGVRRDHPPRPHQLGAGHRRLRRHLQHSAAVVLRPAVQCQRPGLRRLLRPGVHAALPHHLPVLHDRGAGPPHQLGDAAPAPPAGRPRLGGAARGRDRLPLARHQHHQHQAHRFRHRRRLRRLRRLVLRGPPGLHQPRVLHLHGERRGAGDRRDGRHGQPDRRRHRRLRHDRRHRDPARARLAQAGIRSRLRADPVSHAAVRPRHGAADDLEAARPHLLPRALDLPARAPPGARRCRGEGHG